MQVLQVITLKKLINDTKVPNLVTTVLADYRSFDTMFETAVVFIAMLGIFTLLRREEKKDDELDQINDSLIIRVAARFMTPFIQLFGLYVIAHGHYSPGGGFQGGVILGTSLILLAMANNMAFVKTFLCVEKMVSLAAIGVLIFAGWGLSSNGIWSPLFFRLFCVVKYFTFLQEK